MNDELELDLQRTLRTMPAPLGPAAADRIWRDLEAVLLGEAPDNVDALDLVAADDLELRASGQRGSRTVYRWLAVAAVALILVAITVWRGRGEGAIGEVPDATQPSTTPAPTVPYGEIPPLDDASIFYLPDPMPDGWHVSQVLHGVDFPMDWREEGGPQDAEPPIPDGTFRELNVFLYRDDGRAFANLGITETPFRLDDSSLVRPLTPAAVDGYAAAGLSPSVEWSWTMDGRRMRLAVVGSESLAEPLLSVSPVSGSAVVNAVAEGQRAARSLPVLESIDLALGANLTARGPNDRVIAVCADAEIATCAFVSTIYGAKDLALGWAGTESGAFAYGWAPASLAERLDGERVRLHTNDHGAFLTDIADVLVGSNGSGEMIGRPRADLVGMPRLASLDAAVGYVPITPGVSDVPIVVGAQLGEIEAVGDMSVFYLPSPMPQGWHVARVRPVIEERSEIEAESGVFNRPPSPPLPGNALRVFQVDLVSEDGTAAQLVVTEMPRPRTDADIASVGEPTQLGRRNVRLIGSSLEGWPGGVSPFRDETDRRTWNWVQDEREISLDGDLTDGDAAALIESIVPVRGAEVVAAVRAGQGYAFRLPVVAEQRVGSLRLTARGTDGRALFLCAEGNGPTRCASGLTQWNVPGVAQLEVPGSAGSVLLAAWVPAERDADITPTMAGDGSEVTPDTYRTGLGTFVVLIDGGLALKVPTTAIELVRPDAQLIGMPRNDA